MNVLFFTFEPLALSNRPRVEQILRTYDALQRLNVQVEFLRWYDGRQRGDILHFYGRISSDLLALAHASGMKVVVTDWFSTGALRSPMQVTVRRVAMRIAERILPRILTEMFQWRSYQKADACVVMTSSEAALLSTLFQVTSEKIHVVPPATDGQKLKGLYEELLGSRATMTPASTIETRLSV